MTVYLASIFRDAESYLDRYFGQIGELERLLGEQVQLVVCEGDSADGTREALTQHMVDHGEGALLRLDHGGPKFESVDDPQRWENIAKVCNKVMQHVDYVIRDDDAFIYVESDLEWPPETMGALLADISVWRKDRPPVGAVSPMSMRRADGRFWDTWGYRKDGQRFGPWPPYHPSLPSADRLARIDSSGSCFVTWGCWARNVRFDPRDCILGVGRTLAAQGVPLYLDQQVAVWQP